ncbi:peripheral-type benzodiazepine receptor-associated protein 1 [Pleurodeles waltl]|uniref:peripheral-type benzodiazepine receptor-associated protein 1 n=1 Tax=Pleurodeles waltl TaxID=8319 RepID=UPI003709948F
MMKDSPNNSRFSPKKSDVILLEDCRREVDQLKLELENEKLKTQEFRRKFAVEVKGIKEAAEKEKRKLVDDLRSKWELQKTRESQHLKDLIVREREVEIRQLLRWKDAELRELQSFLEKERNAAVRQARDLQKQLAEELLNRGYSSKSGSVRRLSEGDSGASECQCKLQDVLSKLRWEIDGEQAARIRHLKVELDVERNLFLKYILEGSKWDFAALLKSKPKPLTSVVGKFDLENNSINIQACRPRSLESTISKPLSPCSTASRPRSLDAIVPKTDSTDSVLAQQESPVNLVIKAVAPRTSGLPLLNYTEDNNEDSSAWIVLSKDSELQCLSPEPQQQPTSPECKEGWLPPVEMFSVRSTKILEKSHHMEPQWLNADSSPLIKQNAELVFALQELEHRCISLQEENNLLRKNTFPETDEKVKRLKKKNAELAVIAKRLEERAHKLQEANLKVMKAPVHLKGSSIEVCKKAFARQRAKDLAEQANALLAKDKQIEALQQECQELKAKLAMGTECSNWLNLCDLDRLLRESQKEVLRLQRQIAIKYLKESLHLSKVGARGSSPFTVISMGATGGIHIDTSVLSGPVEEGEDVASEKPSSGKDEQELELSKKRKEFENLEQEVKKKQKRCEQLETILKEVKSENVKLLEENSRLGGRAARTHKVESENADLKSLLVSVTEQRDSAVQERQQLQSKLENLEQVLKHMREVAERRQQLEKEHEDALIALQGRQEEVKRLHQAHVEAKREHEGAVHLLENTLDCMQARVKDLEEKCLSQTKQFSLLSQELERFRLNNGKIDLLPSKVVTSELPTPPCCSSPKENHNEKDPSSSWDVISWGDLSHDESHSSFVYLSLSDLPTASFDDNIKDGVAEMQGVHQPCNAICNINKFTVELPSLVNEKEKKKSETFPSSPKSGSHNSSKSCNSTEVDTASEMEEIEVDSVSVIPEPQSRPPAKLQVFLARYSYNPFDGPNENPEAELPLTAGEYIYIYGETDDDGFYEGELMDGRRGLVPSNFVERVSDDDLMTAQPPEVSELSHSSFQDTSFISSCSVERSNLPEEEEGSLSPLLSGLPRSSNEQTDISAVPYPRKLTLIKQLARSIVVGWEPPLVPAGCGSIQSYNIYLDTELRQNVQCGSPTKALLEKLDLKTKVYRVSVQSVTENGNSDRWRCTLLVGSGYSIAPAHLRVRSLTATSAEITWQPSNSNYAHAVYLNEEECGLTKAGTYWYVLRNLRPSTQYNVKVESRPHRTPWVLPPERQENKSTVMQLTTPSAGPPDAPLDVQVELGPTPGILIISWLPVTIDAAGTSNGVRVTGYAVYADGQKVLEVTSPTAGSVLLGMSHLQLLQVSREVSVRTMSPQGESVDSVPAQIPSALLKVPDSLFLLNNSLVYEPPFSEYLDSRKRLTSSPYSTQSETTSKSNAKLSNQTVANEFEIKEHTLHTESPVGGGGQFDSLPNEEPVNDLDLGHCAFSGHPCRVISQSISLLEAKAHMAHIQGTPCTIVHAADCGHPVEHALHPKFCEVSAIPRMSTLPAIDSNLQHENQQELPLFGSSVWNCQITLSDFELKKEARNARISEKQMKDGVTHLNQAEKVSESCLSSETALSECDRDHVNKAGFRGGSVQEFLELSSDEKVDAEDSFTWQTTDEAEEKEMSNPEDVHFASPANRSSDLSDILEEEEDNQHTEMPTKNKFSQKDHDNIGESSGKLDSCETDSDEDILERILELPLQKYCNKKLFSIPEVTEEEEDDDESLAPQETNVHPSCSKESLNYYIAEDMALLKNLQEVPKTNICEPDQNSLPGASGEGQLDTFYPDEQIVPQQDWCLRKNACVSDQQESSVTCTSAEIAGCHKNKDCYTNEQPKGRCESFRKSHTFVKEQCSRLLSSCNQPGGSRRKMHVLNERVTSGACDFPKADIDIWKGRQGTSHNSCRKHASSFTKPTSKSTSSFFTKGMEIDIEYDTEDEDGVLNISKSVIQQSPDCRLKGHHLSCSSWSSQFDSTLSRQKRKELTQQAVVESDGNGYLSCENGVTSVWSGPAQSQMNSFDPRRDSEDRGWRKEHNKMICKERHKRHEKENPDVSLHSRICGSQSRNSIFQLSACAPLKQGSIRKMKLNQQANHSDEARDDLKDLTSEDLKRVTLEVMKESDLELSNTAILEGVRSSKKSLQHDSLRLFVALFDYDPVTMSPNLDAAFEELPFKEGQIIKVFGDKDADGFYKGECNGKKGYIPCNMVSELEVENEEVEHQLLHHEFLTAKTSLEELEVFSTFPPTPHRLAIPPPKPRRLKKELNLQVCRTELNVARTMVAIFDYNPRESSPNVDVEAELTFNAGDIITIYGSMDDDGFYYGELNGHRGLVPSNFLEVSALTGKATNGILPQDVDSQGLHSERQRLRKKRRK